MTSYKIDNTRTFLQTERLRLRPLTTEDVDGPYLDWFNDPEVCRFNGHYVYPYTREMALEFVAGLAASPDLVLAVTMREAGVHIGNVALQEVDRLHRTAEFAIVMGDKDHWGKGLAFEAASALLQHGFHAMNLHRVAAGTLAENAAMRRLAGRLGMQEEGTRRQALFKNGSYHDVVEFGLLASEFQPEVSS